MRRVALIVLAACKSSLPAMEIDGGPDGATPDAAIDGAPDAPNAPDAAADAALVDMAPDGHGPYADPFAPPAGDAADLLAGPLVLDVADAGRQ